MCPRTRRPRPDRTDRAASAVEYSLIVVAIAAVIVVIVFLLGEMTRANFGTTCQELDAQIVSSASC